MFKKLCNIIEQNFGTDQVTLLKKDNTGEDPLLLLEDIVSNKNANLLIECLLENGDEEVYWFLWDKDIYSITHLPDPLPLTQK